MFCGLPLSLDRRRCEDGGPLPDCAMNELALNFDF